ncbi:NOL1/NOP2/sun family putative RNA methylase [Nanoarchaeota archaeon]
MELKMKPLFKERMQKLLPNKKDFSEFEKLIGEEPQSFIRCNTLKITPERLFKKLSKKWKVVQPYKEYPEIMIVDQDLLPGELGRALEHILGYYYIQEISSMMSGIALDPQPGEFVLDMCAAPGSKTTQIAARMENQGTIIANEMNLGRVKILSANLERCGVSNGIMTRRDGIALCARMAREGFKFDRILVDAPCSGEGTLRSSPKNLVMWNPNVVKRLCGQQKNMVAFALKCLKKGGTLVYSTCTHSPEENEGVVDFALKNFPIKVESISLPLKCREGVKTWEGAEYSKEIEKVCRIYPQDNDSEGFFVSKMTLIGDVEK